MEDTKGKESEITNRFRDEELHMALMKMVAEQNQEKFLEYDCATDTAYFYVVTNGRFFMKEMMEHFWESETQVFARVAEEDHEAYRKELEKSLKKPTNRVFDIRYLDEKGKMNWNRVYLVSIANEEGKVYKLAARFISIHKERMATDLLRAQAERDSLTGVYNHKTYEEMCKSIIRKHSETLLFMIVDIDNFKHINDIHGHHAGDSVIKRVGDVLTLATQERGIAGRIGGDEFSACFYGITSKEEATAICNRIKEALKKADDGAEFTVSMGVVRSEGRVCTYEEFYYEADEALYFVKEHGKNQVIFSEEIAQKQQELWQEKHRMGELTEEEAALDDMMEYCLIADPGTKKVLYMNKPAREAMGLALEEVQNMCCYELLMGRCKECDMCELFTTRVHVLDDTESCGLRKYIPNGRFITQSKYHNWKGAPARMIVLLDLNDSRYIEEYFEKETESQETIEQCWNLIYDGATQDVDYPQILQVLNRYYDADCCAIITKNGDEYKEIFEYHNESGQVVADGLYKSLEDGIFPRMEVLIDEDGYMRRRHIEQRLMENIDLIPELQSGFVHSTLGIKLARHDEFAGILLIINPKHHFDDYSILKRIGIFFTTDLLRKRLSDNKRYEENHDVMTKLWNRAFFAQWQALYGHRFKKNLGVFTVDILHLADINEEFGYDEGNRVLMEIAELFRKVFGGYSIFRYDDDEILTICHNVDKNSFEKLVNYAKELIDELHVELCVGYSWGGDKDLAEIMRTAHEYLEKDRKRHSDEDAEDSRLRKHIKQGLIDRILDGSFHVFLQPKVRVSDEKTVGGEALIRLYDEVRKIVSPAYFIPMLEQHDMIYIIDLFVLREVLTFQKNALNAGKEVVPISVNFSKNTLMLEGLIPYIQQLCHEFPIPSGLVQIEITETISSMDHMLVNKIANSLRNMGFSMSMDDFGAQYSNIAVLTQFDFDTVKIDRSLLANVEANNKCGMVLKHTISMLKALGMETVMEGVETKEQVEILRELGSDTIQGFYYGKPEPHEKFYELYMSDK